MASARTFDLKIVTQSGPEITFTSINKEEHELVEAFLKSKKLRVKNEMNDEMLLAGAGVGGLSDDDDSDEDMASAASEGDKKSKPRLANAGDDDSEEGMHCNP